MKILAMTAAILALLALPAQAQMGGGRHHKGNDADQKKPKVDEKAYQDALKRIPDSKDKYDPWGMTKKPQ